MIKIEQLDVETNLEILKEQVEVTKGARMAIGGAFIWDHTTQGHDYWQQVVMDLKVIEVQLQDRVDTLIRLKIDGLEAS